MKAALVLSIFFYFTAGVLYAHKHRVSNIQDYKKLEQKIAPGDTVELQNGIWKDVDLILSINGTEQAILVYIAETPGKVIFSGESKVRIGASYVELNGITFINGFANKGAVIEYRESSKKLANHSRVTNCAIDDYNNLDRMSENHWVSIYGRHNRFDHNYIANKKNLGTTLIVELNDTLNQNNHHRIDHNFFGERPRLGSNGGETIRIGTSTYSRTTSATVIEDNYFFKCSGEVEIISVKSCDNILRRNTFYECEGGLVLRHGNRNIVNDNFFIGNNKPNTGGVRVINAGHRIFNNIFYQLAGDRFRSALTILNGVPNSPLNRYDPVKDILIAQNVFIECTNIDLCAGKDLERTARPIDVVVAGNTFYNNKPTLFTINDKIDGIHFTGNVSNKVFQGVPSNGFLIKPFSITTAGYNWTIPASAINEKGLNNVTISKKMAIKDVPMPTSFKPFADEKNTGTTWYSKQSAPTTLIGKVIPVAPGQNTLFDKITDASAGDTLLLQPGIYSIDKTIEIRVPLSIRYSTQGANKPLLKFSGDKSGFSFFSIENGGSLHLQYLKFNGESENGTAQSFIRTSLQPMIEHYNLFVDGCDFEAISDARKQVLITTKSTFADTIEFINSSFTNISGDAISIAAEKDDKGMYNAEYVIFKNCLFNRILMGAIDVYRGGNDESTTGPYFIMDHCVFNDVANVELGNVVKLNGVQYSNITNTIFYNAGRAGRVVKFEDFGWTKNTINYCAFHIAGRIDSFYPNIVGNYQWKIDPQFKNVAKGNFELKSTSPLLKKGSDNKDIGCIWENGYLNNKNQH